MCAVVDPAAGETVKGYETSSDDELRGAIARADRAHRDGRKLRRSPIAPRLCGAVGELHSERRTELTEIIGAEMGKPVRQVRGEVEARDLETQLAHALPAATRTFLARLANLND